MTTDASRILEQLSNEKVKRMAKLGFKIPEELMKQITAEAEILWPGGGIIAIRRLIRDSLRRLWRYCSGNDRA